MSTIIHMPSLSPGMTEGKLVQWLKKEGDWVRRGEVIAELETDKSLLELESVATGRIEQILVRESDDPIAVDTPLALLAPDDETAASEFEAAPAAAVPGSTGADPLTTTAQAVINESVSPAVAGNRGEQVTASTRASPRAGFRASPLARRLAAEAGVPLAGLAGSGPGGRIVKADLERLVGDQPAPTYTQLPHSSTRRIIAARLAEAATTIPHFYLTLDCRMDALLALRSELNSAVAVGDKLSVNDFIIRACALALRQVPQLNATWGEDAIRLHRDVDIAVAVDAPDGLVTPIVRKADTRSVASIAAEMKQLAGRARERKLRPEEFQGGGFTISSLGMHGIREFTAIINPPHVAILAVGAAEARPVVQGGDLAVAMMMSCTLSCDHRAIDGATGAAFLKRLRELIEQPQALA